jgi:hypothetical protein
LAIPDDDVHDGTELWEELVRTRRQFRMVCCGSVSASDGTGYRNTRNDYGDQVHQMLFDPEWRHRGGNGFFRLIELLPGGRRAQVRSFSPFLEGQGMFPYITTPDCQFEIEIDPVFADYEGWAEATGLTSTAPDADSDGDGLQNVAEFGFVLDPIAFDQSPTVLRETSDGGLVMDFPLRRRAGDFGLQVEVQRNSGLDEAGWQPISADPVPIGDLAKSQNGVIDPRAEWVSADLGMPPLTSGSEFYRLVFSITTTED